MGGEKRGQTPFLAFLLLIAVAILVVLLSPGGPDDPGTPDVPPGPDEAAPPDPGTLDAEHRAPAAWAVEPHRTGRLRIVVSSGEGPVAGARIEVRPENGESGTVRSDAEGTVALDAVPAGWAEVRTEVEGFSPKDSRAMVPLGGLVEVRVHLRRPRVLTGTAVTHDGDPVAGASVRLFDTAGAYIDGEGWEPLDRPIGKTRTRADGRFRAEGLAGSHLASALFLVSAEGFRTTLYSGRDGIRLPLAPGGGIEGRVLSGPGRPIAAARVVAVPVTHANLWREDVARRRGTSARQDEAILPVATRTDSAGRYRLAGLGLNEPYLVRFFADGFSFLEVRSVRVSGEALDVTLVPGGTVTATVRNEDGQPISGARIQVTGPWIRWFPGADTGADGRARVGALPAGRLNVRASAAGFGYADVKVWMVKGRDAVAEIVLTPRGGGSPEQAASPTENETLTGRVLFPGGEPVSRGFVTVRPGLRRTAIEPDGGFRIDFLPAGEVEVLVDPFAGEDVTTTATLPGPAHSVEVPRRRGLRGRLVLPPGGSTPLRVAARYQSTGTWFTWSSDADGACPFRLSLRPGPHRVEFRVGGYRPLIWNGEIPASGALSTGDLTLDPGRALTGRVLDEVGVPIPDAEVRVHDSPGSPGRVRTGLSGEFRLTGFGAEATALFVSADGYLGISRTVHGDTRTVDFVLRRGVRIEVSVRAENGIPIRGAVVNLERTVPGRQIDPVTTGSDGGAAWRVEPGRYRLTASVSAKLTGGEERTETRDLELDAASPAERVVMVPR